MKNASRYRDRNKRAAEHQTPTPREYAGWCIDVLPRLAFGMRSVVSGIWFYWHKQQRKVLRNANMPSRVSAGRRHFAFRSYLIAASGSSLAF